MKFRKKLKIVSKNIYIYIYIEQIYNEKHLKAKIKSHNGKINSDFHNNKIPKEASQFICFSVILINSVFRTDKSYYPEMFLEECKYDIKEKKDS